jgi:hypothetical protein
MAHFVKKNILYGSDVTLFSCNSVSSPLGGSFPTRSSLSMAFSLSSYFHHHHSKRQYLTYLQLFEKVQSHLVAFWETLFDFFWFVNCEKKSV